MARWRLTAKHYLNVQGNQWMYEEINRDTGKPARKMYDVPMLLDPEDATHVNYDGEVIVSDGNNSMPRDYIFTGEPTPDMAPIDDEAREISAKFAFKWNNPIESLPGGYSQSILDDFQRQFAEAFAKSKETVPTPNSQSSGVSRSDFAALEQQVQTLMEQNAALIAQVQQQNEAKVSELADAPTPSAPTRRRT